MAFAVWSLAFASLATGVHSQVSPAAAPAPPVNVVGVADSHALDPLAALVGVSKTAGVVPTRTFNPMTVHHGTGMAGDNAVVNVLNDAINGNAAAVKADTQAAIAETPKDSGLFVQGLFQGYVGAQTLMPGEKYCISENVDKLTEDAVALMAELAQVIAQLVAKETPNPMLAITGGSQIIGVVMSVEKLLKGCVRDDFKAVMQQSVRHLQNPQYVKGRMLANGIDIAEVLADAIPAWEANKILEVGKDFGTLMRKILLSKNSGATQMVIPEGVNEAEVGSMVVEGVIAGLFPIGTKVDITDKVDATVHIHIDLHRCIAKEAPYFTTGMDALYVAIAQISTNMEQWQLRQHEGIKTGNPFQMGGQHQFSSARNPGNGQKFYGHDTSSPSGLNWMNKLSGLMGNLPILMERCGMTVEQKTMFATALKSMNQISMAFTIPGPSDKIQAADKAATKFEQAAAAWKVGKYEVFGFALGGLMRDLILVSYPTKYHMDNGELKEYVEEIRHENAFTGSLALSVGAFSLVMLLGLSFFRVARPRSRPAGLLASEMDKHEDIDALEQGAPEEVE